MDTGVLRALNQMLHSIQFNLTTLCKRSVSDPVAQPPRGDNAQEGNANLCTQHEARPHRGPDKYLWDG